MRDIIEIYKNRLVNISSRNKSVLLRKIFKNNHFDLMSFNEFNPKTALNVHQFLIDRVDKPIEIMGDPYKKLESYNAIIETLPADKKETTKKQADRLFNEMISVTGNLTALLQNIAATEKETGRNELYIGYPFAEGFCKDRTFLRAPIMLFPVTLEKKKDVWRLGNSLNESVLINKSFIFAYCKCNEEKVGKFETEFDNLDIFNGDLLVGLQKYLEEIGIKVSLGSVNNGSPLESFTEMKKGSEGEFSAGVINMKKYMILGKFPVSGATYSDYISLSDKWSENDIVSRLLLNTSSPDNLRDSEISEAIAKADIDEKEFYFWSKLDYSQEKAVASAVKLSNLVIFGPPGTGKSETLTNIVSDSLCKGKKVLVVSQKRTAIDVVYNRLSKVSEKLMLVHDSNKYKKDFFVKVLASLENTSEYSDAGFVNPSELSEKINSKIKLLSELSKTLYETRPFGLSLYEMYAKSKKIVATSDEKILLLTAFRKNEKLCSFKYSELIDAIKRLQGDALNDFIAKKKLEDEYSSISRILSNYDIIHHQELTDFLSQLKLHIVKLQEATKLDPFKMEIADVFDVNIATDVNIFKEKSMGWFERENNHLTEPIKSSGLSALFNFSKNKKQEKENKEIYAHKQIAHGEYIDNITDSINILKVHIQNNNMFIESAFVFNKTKSILIGDSSYENCESDILSSVSNISDYKRLVQSLTYFQGIEKDLFAFCSANSILDFDKITSVLNTIEEIAILNQINLIESNEKTISVIDRYETIKNEVSELMEKKNNITVPLIKSVWRKPVEERRHDAQWKEIRRISGLKRQTWSIRKFISKFQQEIFDLFPCWLLSPETVSEIMPLQPGMFDIILFDEASQMFVEDAIPSVFRGKKIVIAGDDKQLQPSRGITASYSEDIDEDDYDSETQSAKEVESLLDLAKVNFQRILLNYHYRSKYEELINFSNHAFYDGKLQISPNIIKSNSAQLPITRIKVDGIWDKNANQVEAEETVKLIGEILRNRKENETIGVITFNIHQRDMILDLLKREAANNAEFSALYNKEAERTDHGEDVNLFVKNIENVQGDERDIIIFSTAYAKNTQGRVSVNFGTLSQSGGENRLNVAVSRAKKAVYLITSIEPSDLDVEKATNLGPKLFKKYLEYVKHISEMRYADAKILLHSLSDAEKHANSSLHFDSPFETEVYDELVALGYKVDTQIGVSGYKIDMAVYCDKRGKYVLGIECDGAAFHSSKSARERDIQRQLYLESKDWKIARIWSRNWWMDRNAEIRKLDLLLKSLL